MMPQVRIRDILVQERGPLAAVVLVALVVRIVYVLQLQASPWFDDPAVDQGFHHAWARAMAAGETYLAGPYFRAPLYTWFLGAVYRLFGPDPLPARLIQAGLGALNCGLLFLLGRYIGGRWVGLLAGLGAALAWALVFFDATLLSPVVIVFLNLLLLLNLLRTQDDLRPGAWIFSGVLLGLSTITRPDILLLAPLIMGWIAWLHWPRWRRVGRYALLFFVGILLPILPVTVRNIVASGDLVMIAANGGVNFFIGNNPKADGFTAAISGIGPHTTLEWYQVQRLRAEQAEGRPLKDSEVSRYYLREAWRFIREETSHAVSLWMRKALYFWSRWEIANNQDLYFVTANYTPVTRWLPVGFWLIGPLGLLGLLLAMSRGRELFPLWGLVLTYYLIGIVFFVSARFRIPAVMVLILLAATALRWLLIAVKQRRWRSLLAAGCVLLGAGFLVSQVPASTDRHQVQGHRHAGFALARQGHHAAAEEMLHEALAREAQANWPPRAGVWYTLGFAQLQQNKLAEAGEAFQRALQLDPQYPDARESLAETLVKQGKYRLAQHEYATLLARQPDDMRVLALLGAAQFLAGDREESLRHLLDAATTDPSQMAIVAWLAQLLEGSGRVAEAAWLLQQTHKHAPQDVPLILMLVRLLTAHPELAGADPDQAIALGREAVRLTGDQDPMAWHALALAEGAAGHVQEARQAARRALQLARAGGDEQLSQWLNAELQPFLEGQSR